MNRFFSLAILFLTLITPLMAQPAPTQAEKNHELVELLHRTQGQHPCILKMQPDGSIRPTRSTTAMHDRIERLVQLIRRVRYPRILTKGADGSLHVKATDAVDGGWRFTDPWVFTQTPEERTSSLRRYRLLVERLSKHTR